MDLRLRCSRSMRRRTLGNTGKPDAGLIETRSFCGTLLLELVEGDCSGDIPALATALLDVRSVKMDYRTEYRGMLRRLTEEITGLVADARSSTKGRFLSSFKERSDGGWLQIQLELLREVLDSSDFTAAIQRILNFPHEKLSSSNDIVKADRPVRWTPSAIRQLLNGNPRRKTPLNHTLAAFGLESVAEHVRVPHKSRDLDTPENRFIKYALEDFRSFLAHAQSVFSASAGWGVSAALTCRLFSVIDDWLGRAIFREIGAMRFTPLGSPVLQRKSGYREVLRWWLRFRTAAELSWKGGEDLFHAGQRNVAELYEYWLFFELLSWFCRMCRAGNRPAIEELIEGFEEGSPNLRLKKNMELGPFAGIFAGRSRRLNARFVYNGRFQASSNRQQRGSWSRALHPDYTLSFWPEEMSETDAEGQELLVHIHFDAKYRVDQFQELFGSELEDDADEEVDGNYKRQDLLKMHAYRDAIKRSQGAYVLYPGRANAAVKFTGFHEILPGIGAFGVAPDQDGNAQGLEALETFLDQVLAHLSNRTTTQERVSYHLADSYATREEPVEYGSLHLPEIDIYDAKFRALPPSEHMVLAAWVENEAQRSLAESENGFVYVRLGRRAGSLHVHPNIAKARHVLLRTHGSRACSGLLLLREPGFRVYTRTQLRRELEAHAGGGGISAWQYSARGDDDEHIYALFRTQPDHGYDGQEWDAEMIMDSVERFESDVRNRPIANVGRMSPYPRILPLKALLRARLNV